MHVHVHAFHVSAYIVTDGSRGSGKLRLFLSVSGSAGVGVVGQNHQTLGCVREQGKHGNLSTHF